jgi:DNA-binding SARP family transcriptional activator
VYEDWPIEQRERLKSEYLTLLTRLCMGAFRDGDYVACLSWGHRMVECDSCREDAHRLLMRCYSRLGQRTMALRQHRLCADALRRELDAIPEAETEEIFRRLQQGQEL